VSTAGSGAEPRRLGILLPSSNTVVEPVTARLLPADGSVTAHFSRLGVTVISDAASSLDQFAPAAMLQAAGLLADAEVALIAWAGTAASWLGFERDTALAAAIEERCGIPATSTVIAINRRLATLGARRIGLVTPYIAALESRIAASYAAAGIGVVATDRLDLTVNTDYGRVAPAAIAAQCRRVAAEHPDAIVVMCTNLRGAPVAAAVAAETGIPVLDSVAVTVEHCLEWLGHPEIRLRTCGPHELTRSC
jgi:maleate isomerase